MTFSEFANILYPFIGEEKTTSDFIVELTNQIMEEPFSKEDKKAKQNDEYNPLSKLETNTLQKIYNGSRPLSKKIARKIFKHLDKAKFVDYINELSVDAQMGIKKELQANNPTINIDNICDSCTALFEEILYECVNKEKKVLKNTPQLIQQQNKPLKKMLTEFLESVEGYGIVSFINRDQFNSIPAYCIEDVIDFIGHIKYKHEHNGNPDKQGNPYQTIITFTDKLFEYINFLKDNSDTPNIRFDGFKLSSVNNIGFEESALNYLKQLRELYQSILVYVDNENDKLKQYHKDEWDKNTLTGSL